MYFSTIVSGWIKTGSESGGFVEATHEFLGIKLKVSNVSIGQNSKSKSNSIKFRILNKFQNEPFLEENERRVSDIVQIYPKELVFEPSAELVLKLPSSVAPKSCGQLVCLYCSNKWLRHGAKQLKWKPLDSFCFHVNARRTQARVVCKKSGLYTIKITQHPQISNKLDPYTDCEVQLTEYPGIQIKFPSGCVIRPTPVTLEAICTDELYSQPAPVPVSGRSHGPCRPLHSFYPEDMDTSNMVDITSTPVVLIRPSKHRFTKPIQLTLPLLGGNFEDFFARENTRIVVLKSKVLDEETVSWKHHYSTPEVRFLHLLKALLRCTIFRATCLATAEDAALQLPENWVLHMAAVSYDLSR